MRKAPGRRWGRQQKSESCTHDWVVWSYSATCHRRRLGHCAGRGRDPYPGLIGLGLLLAGALGPTAWDTKAGLQISPFAIASLLLLIGLVNHPLERSKPGKALDLIFAWLASGAGIWGIIVLLVGR